MENKKIIIMTIIFLAIIVFGITFFSRYDKVNGVPVETFESKDLGGGMGIMFKPLNSEELKSIGISFKSSFCINESEEDFEYTFYEYNGETDSDLIEIDIDKQTKLVEGEVNAKIKCFQIEDLGSEEGGSLIYFNINKSVNKEKYYILFIDAKKTNSPLFIGINENIKKKYLFDLRENKGKLYAFEDLNYGSEESKEKHYAFEEKY